MRIGDGLGRGEAREHRRTMSHFFVLAIHLILSREEHESWAVYLTPYFRPSPRRLTIPTGSKERTKKLIIATTVAIPRMIQRKCWDVPARTASKNGFILNAPALKKQQRTKSSIVKSVCWQHYTLHLRRRKPLCRGSARRLDAISSSFEALGVEADRRSTSSGADADIATRRWP